jgi:uracil-DNA glycosylase family 4
LTMNKIAEYTTLVAARKACHRCLALGLTNPVDVDGGHFDSDEIGPWSLWQGNLNASLMVVGQDWGGTKYFNKNGGRDAPRNFTNLALIELLGKAGFSIRDIDSQEGQNILFFTNAILCLKHGNLDAKVQKVWFDNCASFLRKQIEIVNPVVVVGLGELAYRAILFGFNMKAGQFRAEVETEKGIMLPNGTRAFAVYHCAKGSQNRNRPMDAQRKDWMRIRPFITKAGIRQ